MKTPISRRPSPTRPKENWETIISKWSLRKTPNDDLVKGRADPMWLSCDSVVTRLVGFVSVSSPSLLSLPVVGGLSSLPPLSFSSRFRTRCARWVPEWHEIDSRDAELTGTNAPDLNNLYNFARDEWIAFLFLGFARHIFCTAQFLLWLIS